MNADGSAQTAITRTPGVDEGHAAWSPDGKQIAFVSNATGNKEVYTMHPDGSSVQQVTNDGAAAASPTWSPDSRTLAYASRNGDLHLYSISVDGTNKRQLTNDPARDDYTPAWSPDGRHIAFTGSDGVDAALYTITPAGSGLTNLGGTASHQPSWSADGTHLIYNTDTELHTVKADGSDDRPLASPAEARGADWSHQPTCKFLGWPCK